MPTISISRSDLDRLIGRRATEKELDAWLPLVKGEVKDLDAATGALKIELQDSNRPDLWCVEGIARQIRCKLKGAPGAYPYVKAAKGRRDQMLVEKGLERVRPFVAGCKARGWTVSGAPAGWQWETPRSRSTHCRRRGSSPRCARG